MEEFESLMLRHNALIEENALLRASLMLVRQQIEEHLTTGEPIYMKSVNLALTEARLNPIGDRYAT